MSNYPTITGKDLIRKLCKAGYIVKRTRGSHFFLTLPGHPKKSTVVKNTSKDVPQGTLLSIKKQLKISREEFINLISLLL
jgi:predicted RNA binding protein YcfA (HicA-like mRNA interferase family)